MFNAPLRRGSFYVSGGEAGFVFQASISWSAAWLAPIVPIYTRKSSGSRVAAVSPIFRKTAVAAKYATLDQTVVWEGSFIKRPSGE